jgi:transcriptional regulator with XRE-family HTH domain
VINADALSHARTRCGLSQRRLAQLIGLNYQVIRRLEAGGGDGNLLIRDLQRLCDTLGVHPVSLLAEPTNPLPAQIAEEQGLELDLAQARLLRRIQRADNVRRNLRADDQQLILPVLLKLHLATTTTGGRLVLTPTTTGDLTAPPSPLPQGVSA